MKPGLKKVAIATLMVSALTLSACGGSEGSKSASGSSSSESSSDTLQVSADGALNLQDRDKLQDGGELRLPLQELPEQMNPFQADSPGYSRDLWVWTNPQIALFDGDGTYHANPAYIDEVTDETVDGKTVVTFKINEKATYNDGTPIDWKSFENTWKFNNGTNTEVAVNSTDGYELIESVQPGANDKEAVITFNQVYAWWQGLFNILVPPQVNTNELFNTGYLEENHPEWGAGPFKIENVDFNTGTISFVRNEKWWGEPAKLDRVIYRQLEDQASLNALKAGEIDVTAVSNKERLAAAKSLGDKVELRTALDPSNVLMMVNAKAPLLSDINVRKAVFTGIDRSQLAAIRFNGLGYTEELPGSFILYPGQKGYEDNFGAVVKYSQDDAKAILDEAGWVEGSDGFREKDGKKLTLRNVITGDSQATKASATALQKMMKDIGIDLQIEQRPSSEFSNIMKNRDFDIFGLRFTSTDPFGVAYFKQTYASNSELNKSGTGTPELDAQIEELQKIADPDEQIKKANELEREAFAQYGILPFANGPVIVATPPKLANYGSPFFANLPKEDIGWMK